MTSHRLPSVKRLNNEKPILEKIADHPWENKVTFNPASILVTHQDELKRIIAELPFTAQTKRALRSYAALCFLLYRAQGKKSLQFDYTCSSIGFAVLTPELKLVARHTEPVMLPDQDYDNLGVEDPRITKVNSRYVMFYTAYSAAEPANKIRIGLATSTNLFDWKKHGLLHGDFNSIDNKNAVLFPGQINGKYVMLHRPMKGDQAMAVHWATGKDIFAPWLLWQYLRGATFSCTILETEQVMVQENTI